jgi:hypothetical protein
VRIACLLFLLPTIAHAENLIVAGEAGVQEVALDGKVVRKLSPTPAKQPRFVPDHSAIVFLTRTGGELHSVALDGSGEKKLASLPKHYTICADAADYQKGHRFSVDDLNVQEDGDFELDKSGKAACLSLKDRNVNMLNVDVQFHVDLTTGKVHHHIESPDGCPARAPLPKCESPDRPERKPPPKLSYDIDNHKLVRWDGDKETVVSEIGPDDFEAGEVSPSGRWETINGNESQGDYIHRDLFLLDRKEGKIWPVRLGAAPKPLSPRQVKGIGKIKIKTADSVGESTVRWLFGQDILQVDTLIVSPGVSAIELPGDLAR